MNRSFLGREGKNEDYRYMTTTQAYRTSTDEVHTAPHKFCSQLTYFIANVFSSLRVFDNCSFVAVYFSYHDHYQKVLSGMHTLSSSK